MTALFENRALTLYMDDAQLARQAVLDGDAFAELYQRHVTHVYRYHLAHIGNTKDAEDLTSQTFMAALENIRSFRGDGSFGAWLMGIAARKRALFFRERPPETSLDDARHLPALELPADRSAGKRMRSAQVLRALRSLSPERAEALILCFFSGLSAAEAGRVLGKREAAVRMLVSRGLQDLRTRTSLAFEVDDE